MNRQEIRETIADYEYYRNGFNRLSGCCVKIVNLRILKNKYIYDTILQISFDHFERYNNCEYPKKVIQDWFNRGLVKKNLKKS